MDIYKAKGQGSFVFIQNTREKIHFAEYDYLDGCFYPQQDIEVYDLIEGMDFLEQVESGCIRDRDGCLKNVFADGYDSNLGLFCMDAKSSFSQGGFLVTPDTWKKLCSRYEIKVNWQINNKYMINK